MGRFLSLSGTRADDIRSMLGQLRFYAGLMVFLLNHDSTLVEFCQNSGAAMEWVRVCHRHFAGTEVPSWT